MEIRHNRLYCNRENDFELFFSITDYLNSFFTSNNPEDIIKFYSFFKDRDSLIKWMKERPKGHYDIIEVEGNKDIIVVILTADFYGKFAKACRDDIFKGLHIIFVQSGGLEDYYFNGAHNFNAGIKKAMEYNPKWIILSNDDMYKIDDVEVLKNELSKLDNKKNDIVFLEKGNYYSIPLFLGKKSWRYEIYRYIRGKELAKLYRKFEIDYFIAYYNYKFKLVFKKIPNTDFVNFSAIGIFSSNYIKKFENIFDDTYINDTDDADFSFRLKLENANTAFIKYRIGAFIGSTLGTNIARVLRAVPSRAYFNYKYAGILNDLIKKSL